MLYDEKNLFYKFSSANFSTVPKFVKCIVVRLFVCLLLQLLSYSKVGYILANKDFIATVSFTELGKLNLVEICNS